MFEPVRFGKYLLVDRIARGGMAEVFKARSQGPMGFEKLLVIKKILPHLSRNPDFVKLFVNEAKISVSMNHANIVQVFELGKVAQDFFIAMEFLHGRDLAKVMRSARRRGVEISIPLAVYITTEIARGLEYAHNLRDPRGRPLNVIHRDISPHNVMVSFEGDVRLFDFGIANVGALAAPQVGGGKMGYMAPEQASGQHIDHRVDLFAMGIVLYELVTRSKLYPQRKPEDKRTMVRSATFVQPRKLNNRISRELEAIILRALARDPDQRFDSARTFREHLQEFMYRSRMRVQREDLAALMRELYAHELEKEGGTSTILNLPDFGEVDLEWEPPAEEGGASEAVSEERDPDPGDEQREDSTTTTENRLGRLLRGERRQINLLALEIIGLTDLSERLSERQLVRLQFSIMRLIVRIVKRWNGHVHHHSSDQLLVTWGLTETGERDLEACYRCALDLAGVGPRLERDKRVRVGLSIGLHRGEVVVGKGRPRRGRESRNFMAVGDTVKLARRLCAAAANNEVLASSKAIQMAPWVVSTPAPVVPVKWSAREITPHRVQRVQTGRGAGVSGLGRWIPRGSSVTQVKQAIQNAARGSTTALVLRGEAGTGKGRLVREIKRLATKNKLAFNMARGAMHQVETPFYAWRQIFEQILGIGPGDDQETQRRKLSRLEELRLQPLDIHILGQLFGVRFKDSNLRYLTGQQIQAELSQVIQRIFVTLAEERFLILSFINAGWFDRYSMAVARRLFERFQNERLLLVFTLRPDEQAPIQGEDVLELALPPMGEAETSAFIAEVLGVESAPAELTEVLYGLAGGNPLYLKELIQVLQQRKMLQMEEGRLLLKGRLRPEDLPASLQDLIGSRIDQLDRPERMVLELASVVGRYFDTELVRSIARVPTNRFQQICNRLQGLALIRPEPLRSEPERWGFRNEVIWEVAYHGILQARREDFHGKVGEALEEAAGEDLRGLYERLTYHYQRANLPQRAARFCELDGRALSREYYDKEAIRRFQRAILLLRATTQGDEHRILTHLAELYEELGQLHLRGMALREAEKAFQMALDYAGEAEDQGLEIRSLIALGRASSQLHKHHMAGSLLERAAEEASASGDLRLMCEAHEAQGHYMLSQGDILGARESLKQAMKAAQRRGENDRIARILKAFAGYHISVGDFGRARRHLLRALDLLPDDRSQLLLRGQIHTRLGISWLKEEHWEEALRSYQEAYRINEMIEYRRGVITGLHNIGDAYLGMGEEARAYRFFEESLAMASRYDWEEGVQINRAFLGYLNGLQGDLAQGERALRAALETSRKWEAREARNQVKRFLGALLVRAGRNQEGQELIDEAQEEASAALAGQLLEDTDVE